MEYLENCWLGPIDCVGADGIRTCDLLRDGQEFLSARRGAAEKRELGSIFTAPLPTTPAVRE
jgi:hypothetical protein